MWFFFCFSESSNKENNESPEWSFTTVRKKKTEGRKVLNGTVSTASPGRRNANDTAEMLKFDSVVSSSSSSAGSGPAE